MGKKRKTKALRLRIATPTAGRVTKLRTQLKRIRIPFGLAVGCIGLYFTYTLTGAEDLRVKVYEPLFGELSNARTVVLGGNFENFSNAVFNQLTRNGDLQRIPAPLRAQIAAVYDDISRFQADLNVVTELIERNISQRIIMGLRTQAEDRAWIAATSAKLRRESEAQPGIAAMASFQDEPYGKESGY